MLIMVQIFLLFFISNCILNQCNQSFIYIDVFSLPFLLNLNVDLFLSFITFRIIEKMTFLSFYTFGSEKEECSGKNAKRVEAIGRNMKAIERAKLGFMECSGKVDVGQRTWNLLHNNDTEPLL